MRARGCLAASPDPGENESHHLLRKDCADSAVEGRDEETRLDWLARVEVRADGDEWICAVISEKGRLRKW